MKKKSNIIVLGGALLVSLGLISCQGANSLPIEANVFENGRFYYDTSKADYNISVKLGKEGDVSNVSSGKVKAEAGDYSYKNGILTLSKNFLGKINPGEKTVSVEISGKRVSVPGYFVNKVITTAQEFQDINNNLTYYYILGNDIDLSTISNFEPIGHMGEETDPTNEYFHGILDGNGYTVKNANVLYSDSVASNFNVYNGTGTMFTHDHHKAGDNVGLFQIIGKSGVVRNTTFDNIHVRGRTICGALAGNVAGTVENVRLTSSNRVEMSTHFYDDDCNMGGAFGIVGGSGYVSNVISEVTNLSLGATGGTSYSYNGANIDVQPGVYLDFGNDYVGKTGNGWDHTAQANNTDPWWRFAAADKQLANSTAKTVDSNNSNTNGVYAFAGKTWGEIKDCVAKGFKITPMNGTQRDVFFSQTHKGSNKPTSGETDLGALTNDLLLSEAEMKSSTNYSSFDTDLWNIEDNKIPTLKHYYTLTSSAE